MDVFNLSAKLSLDDSEYTKGLNSAESKASSFGSTAISKIGGGLKMAAKVGVAAIGAAGAAVGALTTAAVNQYAEFEQLQGGIETLYKNSADKMMQYADSAFRDAGMSANEYMSTAIESSAAMISALGGDTEKAAEMTNMAIIDMSDNVNKMGTSMESIQDAYRGFSRQNFTMLDNLALGFAGTKEGMQELLDKAQEISGIKYNISSYADIVQAIHVVQEEMGIAGTTALEASETISGSWNMVKSAWDNLVTGFANGEANIDQLMSNLKDSIFGYVDESGDKVKGLLDNLMPVVSQALKGISKFITDAIPELLDSIPDMITNFAPDLLSAATNLVGQLLTSLPEMFVSITEIIPQILNTITESTGDIDFSAMVESFMSGLMTAFDNATEIGTGLLQKISEGIRANLPTLIESGMNALMEFSGHLRENAGKFIDAGLDMIESLADGIIAGFPTFIKTIPTIVSNVAGIINDNAPKLIKTGMTIIIKLVAGIIKAIPTLIQELPKIIKAIWDAFMAFNWLSLGAKLVTFIGNGIKSVGANLPSILQGIGSKAMSFFQNLNWSAIGSKAISLIMKGITSLINAIPNTLLGIAKAALNIFKAVNWGMLGINLVKGIANGVIGGASALYNAVTNIAKSALNKIKSVLGIKSPSKEGKKLGYYLAQGLAGGIKAGESEAVKSANEMADKVLSAAQTRLDNYKVYHKMSLKEEMNYWNAVRNQIQKGTQARVDADAKYFEARRNLKAERKEHKRQLKQAKKEAKQLAKEYKKNYKEVKKQLKEDIKAVNDELAETIDEINDKLADKISDLQDQYDSAVESRKSSIMGMTGLFDSVSFNTVIDKKTLLSNIADQNKALLEWDKTLDSLEERLGHDSPLFKALQEMGVENLGTLQEINSMSNEELKQYANLYDQKAKIAEERSIQENADLLATVQEQQEEARKQAAEEIAQAEKDAADEIDKLTKEANATLTALKNQYTKDMKELARSVKGQGKDVGRAIIKGAKEGLKGFEKVMEKPAQKAAKAALNAVKKILGIKSPSREFMKVGKMIDLGMVEGIENNIAAVKRSVAELGEATLGTVGTNSNTSQSNNITMNVYGAQGQNVRELADIVQQRLAQNIYTLKRGLQGA